MSEVEALAPAGGGGSILASYRRRLASGWQADSEQETAVRHLDSLLGALRSEQGKAPARGLYLHGPVGRGKSQLMGLFMENVAPVKARRIHMHAFMPELHRRLLEVRSDDPVRLIAEELAADIRVLGFDEFFVSNLGDGILLGRLFQHLFRRGVSVVATSNWPLDDLFLNGRNRQQLMPYLKVLKENLRAIDLGKGTDYRIDDDPRWPLYALTGSASAGEKLASLWRRYESGEPGAATAGIAAKAVAGMAAWFTFDAICKSNTGRLQYLELMRHFETLVIEDVPLLGETDSDPALRFVTLIDICYEHHCRVIVSAAAHPESLYAGGPVTEAFRRTASRLSEMQGW